MNKESFISALRNTGTIPLDLDAIVQAFPYFQSAHILTAKSSHTSSSHLSDNLLRAAAAFSVDRNKLFELIQEDKLSTSHPISKLEADENPSKSIPEQLTLTNEVRIAKHQTNESIEVAAIEIPTTEIKEEIPLVLPIKAIGVLDEVLANIEALKESKRLAKSSFDEFVSDNTQKTPVTVKILPSFTPLNKLPLFKINSFVTPIEYKNHDLQDGRLGESTGSSGQLDILQQYLQYVRKQKSPKQDDQLAVIESFIKRNPTISKPTEASLEQIKADFSQHSTKETGELVTENLANIFIKQKKYTKAIEIYHKLSLKYPEKSTYFAQKITELQNL